MTFTGPFTADTDNDDASDSLECRLGSDLNKYMDVQVRNL